MRTRSPLTGWKRKEKMEIKITRQVIAFEPMHCQRQDCQEELNALCRHSFELQEGFKMELWLCDKCSKELEKNKSLSFKDLKDRL
jgi:hypothetical protein